MDNKRRIRYGRVRNGPRKGHPKSILITESNGDEIYFGIASCNLSEDKWDKNEGVNNWALDRLELALRLPEQAFDDSNFDGVKIHRTGFLGKCKTSDVKNLLQYFKDRTCCGFSETKQVKKEK